MFETLPAPTRSDVERAVSLAARAPSIHNTQPWRWVYRFGVLELYADRSRHLLALDPDGRSLLFHLFRPHNDLRFSKNARLRLRPYAKLSVFVFGQILPTVLARLRAGGSVGQDPAKLGAPLLHGFWPQIATL